MFKIKTISAFLSFSFSISPSNIQDWFPIGKWLSRVCSNTTVQKHQFFSTHIFIFFIKRILLIKDSSSKEFIDFLCMGRCIHLTFGKGHLFLPNHDPNLLPWQGTPMVGVSWEMAFGPKVPRLSFLSSPSTQHGPVTWRMLLGSRERRQWEGMARFPTWEGSGCPELRAVAAPWLAGAGGSATHVCLPCALLAPGWFPSLAVLPGVLQVKALSAESS